MENCYAKSNCDIKKDNKKAFTLVELLVVISIIALLLSIMMPSLQRARGLAKAIVCATNYKNIHMGSMLYSADNNQAVVPSSVWREHYWPTIIDEYLGGRGRKEHWHAVTSKFWACPVNVPWARKSLNGAKVHRTIDPGTWWAERTGYVLNQRLTDRWTAEGQPIKHTELGRTNQLVFLVEFNQYPINDPRGTQILYVTGYNYTHHYPTYSPDWTFLGHNGKTNVLFLDGHYERLNFQDAPLKYPESASWWEPFKDQRGSYK